MASISAPAVPSRREERVPTEDAGQDNRSKQLKDEYADKRLHEIVPNDEMYFLMENFLLGDPDRQISELGDPITLITKGDDDRAKGDNLMARADYETGAKVAIYQEKLELVTKCLRLASSVTENEDHLGLQKGILDNIDEVMRIAKEYYSTIPRA